MKGICMYVCKICGCTEDRACIHKDGLPCRWVFDDLCSACVIELSSEQHGRGPWGLLLEKSCSNCAHLVESKDLPSRFENYWECDAGRMNDRMPNGEYLTQSFKRSGFDKPNKTVKEAQRHCPDWQVHPRFLKSLALFTEEE